MKKLNVQRVFVATFILISAIYFAGCTGMKFSGAVIDGDKSTVKTMLDNGEAKVNEEIAFGKTPIFYALDNNQDEMVKFLLEKGAKVDVRDDDGRGPLTMAAKEGKNDLVKAMVKSGGNPDSKGEEGMTALMIYAQRKDGLKMAEFLVENGADVNAKNDRMWGKYPLNMSLSKSGNKEVAVYLLEKGAEIKAGALFSALKKDKELGMKMLKAIDNVPSSALLAVIDDDELFNYLLERGADPTSQIETAAGTGSIKALRKLVEAGGEFKDPWNPMEEAKNVETARVLVELGADVDRGFPVHEAVMDEDAKRVRFLVNEAGANMNKLDDKNETTLHMAAAHQKFNMLKVLLECKGPHKINLKDESERTVLDYIGTGNEHVTPKHWKSEYKGVTRAEVRKMLNAKGAKLSSQLN